MLDTGSIPVGDTRLKINMVERWRRHLAIRLRMRGKGARLYGVGKGMRNLFFLVLIGLLGTRASALTEAEIQGYIDEAIKAGGGEVVIPPGEHLITKGLLLKDAKKIRLVGLDAERCVLKLPPLAFAVVSATAEVGMTELKVGRSQNLKPGMRLRIEAAGETDTFTGKPKPYILAIVRELGSGTVLLKEPLKHSVPAETLIRHEDAPNLIEVRGASENVTIEKLCLDGGRVEGDPAVRGHAQLCGLFVAGPYSYEKGPTGPRVQGVKALRCVFQNLHGRGVAFYSAEGGGVEDCTFMDITDEAVDLDHFAERILVQHNHIARSLVGIELNDAKGCTVNANEIWKCGTGVHLWRWCKLTGWNEGNRILDNRFDAMLGNAVQIGEGTGQNSIADNEINDSGKNGIVVRSKATEVKGNRIRGSRGKDEVRAP